MKSALDTALIFLSKRALTHYELKMRLEKKGYAEDEISEAMERVEGWGYINDQAYALFFSQSKLSIWSRKRVQQELLRRGINSSIIEDVLDQVFKAEQELFQCLNLAQKMWSQEAQRWETSYQFKKTYAKIPRELFLKQKIGQKLAQKGYPLYVIHQVLEEASRWD
ncbi:regulatory protein RecX [Desulfitobacterium sp. Sab5]|uniref:regulatory protein RecX n=1 Tax=Desulfitobacterium nosdiversum TaxID=3375356 RepID=UPI003CF989B5